MRQTAITFLMMSIAAVMPAFGGPVSVNLGTAGAFGLLGDTISNTGVSVINGYVGVRDSGGTVTGFYPSGTTVGGPSFVLPPGNTAATNAYTDFVTAFNAAQLLTPTQSFDLSTSRSFTGNTVYSLPSGVSSTTGITLSFDAQNNANEFFVIQTPAAFTMNGAFTFALQNQAQANHIFWIVGTSATISVGSSGPQTFDGTILAGQAFTMSAATGGSGVLAGTINGCVFAGAANSTDSAANTLAGMTIVNGCSSGTPEPGSWGLASLGGLLGIWAWRKRPDRI